MNEYTISIDLHQSITAGSEEEALAQARELIQQGDYTIMIVDVEGA